MADEQMADESGWRAADHSACGSQVDGDLVARLRKRAEGSSGFGPTLSADAADEIERLRAALREIRALHEPKWASEQARAAGKEPWVCSLCGTADGHWPCDTTTTIREVLGDE